MNGKDEIQLFPTMYTMFTRWRYWCGLHGACPAKVRMEQDEDFTWDDRKALRLEKPVPILNEFKQWLDQYKGNVVPKSAIGKANDDQRRSLLPHRFDIKRLENRNIGAETFAYILSNRHAYQPF